MIRNAGILCFNALHVFRLSCNLGYYGLLYGIGDLVGDLFLNNILAGVAELIAYNLCFLVLKGGRKRVYVGLCVVAGLCLIASGFITHHLPCEIIKLIL